MIKLLTYSPNYYKKTFKKSTAENTSPKIQPSFKSGLDYQVAIEIDNTDVSEVEKYFKNRGIEANFSGNKVAAACSKMTAQIFQRLRLPLPAAILAFDFKNNDKLTIKDKEKALGYCCGAGIKTDKQYPNRTVLFDTALMDNILYFNYCENGRIKNHKSLCTHFLGTFIHEFIHSAHYENLQKLHKDDWIDVSNKLNKKNIDKLKPFLSYNSGGYASENLFELIAEEYEKIIADSLDKNLNLPRYNPFIKASHERHKKLNTVIQNAWNGTIDF